MTVTGSVDPGPYSNKWYASVAASAGVSAGVSQQDGNFSLPGVPVSSGANALTVTVTDVSWNVATQILEKCCWRFHRVWSTNWWFFEQQEKESVIAAVNAAREAAQHRTQTRH